eukprot:702981-Hanusia_phi.AAC.4
MALLDSGRLHRCTESWRLSTGERRVLVQGHSSDRHSHWSFLSLRFQNCPNDWRKNCPFDPPAVNPTEVRRSSLWPGSGVLDEHALFLSLLLSHPLSHHLSLTLLCPCHSTAFTRITFTAGTGIDGMMTLRMSNDACSQPLRNVSSRSYCTA